MAKKEEAPQGAPEWVVTYGDCMSLLLCFFISLVAMSEIKKDRFQQAVESIQKAFGGFDGSLGNLPIADFSPNVLIDKLNELEIPDFQNKQGDSPDEGVDGKKLRVTNIREGLKLVVGGTVSFERFAAELEPGEDKKIVKTSALLRGYTTKVLIRGHAARDALPTDSSFADARALSYARANFVARRLEELGVDPVRISVEAVGDNEPLMQQAYTESRRATNRRVEIFVTDNLVSDFAGATQSDENP